MLLLVPLSVKAQKNTTTQQILWVRYHNKLAINEKFQLHTELDMRRFVFPDRQHHWLVPRMHLHHQFHKVVDVGVGAAYFLQAMPQEEEVPVEELRKELRPHQEISLKQSLGNTELSHRYRMEERFFLKTAEEAAAFNFRFRYQFQYQVLLNPKTTGIHYFLKIADEVMFNAGKNIVNNVFDQNRIYGAIQAQLSAKWGAEVGYMHWYQQRSSGVDYYSRHIARFTITHSLNLKKTDHDN